MYIAPKDFIQRKPIMSRLSATENEYFASVRVSKDSKFNGMETMSNKFKYYVPNLVHLNYFYENGSRIYEDVGEHPEYATPLDDSYLGTVANEIAGEEIVYETFENAHTKGLFYDFQLNKRVIDDGGTTNGHHDNYPADGKRLQPTPERFGLLGIHLAAASILTGAGAVLRSPNGSGKFVIAQKVMDLEDDFSVKTTRNKPLVNLKEEPHNGGNPNNIRVHITSGDANMSPWAMWMRHGTISLVLSLCENGRKIGDLAPEMKLFKVAQFFAGDLSLKKTVRMAANHRPALTAAQIEAEIIEQVSKLPDLSPEDKQIIEEWERALDDIETAPEKMDDRADWTAKYQLVDSYRQRHGYRLGHDNVLAVDKLFDNLGPLGIGQRWRETKWAQWTPPREQIAERKKSPPTNTNANIRGRFIKHFAGREGAKANWDSLKLETTVTGLENDIEIKLCDPGATTDQRVEDLIDRYSRKRR